MKNILLIIICSCSFSLELLDDAMPIYTYSAESSAMGGVYRPYKLDEKLTFSHLSRFGGIYTLDAIKYNYKNNNIIFTSHGVDDIPNTTDAWLDIDDDGPNPEEIDYYLNHLDHDFIKYANPQRIFLTYRMLDHMLSHEGAHTILVSQEGSSHIRLSIGLKEVNTIENLVTIIHLIHHYKFEIVRYFTIDFDKGYDENVTVMHFVIRPPKEQSSKNLVVAKKKLIKAIRTQGWVDVDSYSSLTQTPFKLSINGANFIRCVAAWTHILLGKENPYYYSEHQILSTFQTYPHLTR